MLGDQDRRIEVLVQPTQVAATEADRTGRTRELIPDASTTRKSASSS
jgi:hypothetical protein